MPLGAKDTVHGKTSNNVLIAYKTQKGMKNVLVFCLFLLTLCSCGATDKKAQSGDSTNTDTAKIKEHAIYDPDSNVWSGPGSERINKAWCGRVYEDSTTGEMKWAISAQEKRKMKREDVKIVDSLIHLLNNL